MQRILLLFFLAFSCYNIQASHLMGGEITWTCLKSGPNTGFYIFEVKVYRDCQGIPIDTTLNLKTHNIPGMGDIMLNWVSGTDMSPLCNTINGINDPFSCGGLNITAGNGNGAVEEHIYQSDPIRLIGTPDSLGWHFSWSSCCRNSAITNGPSGSFELRAVMYSYTDSLGIVYPNNNDCYDSSPKFYEKPRTILEVGNGYDPLAFSNGFTYSHNAFDEEQDSIAYSFAEPLSYYDYTNTTPPSPGASTFTSPYSYLMPINNIFLNPITGRTYYPADQQGNYVTCTNVKSYRCGQKIAEIFREIQVVLVPPICNLGDTTNGNIGADTLCNVRPIVQPPFFYPGTPAPFQWDTAVHCGDTVAFEFEANDYDYYPNGSRQDLQFSVSGGQFYNYNLGVPCQNPPCATFEELSTGSTPPFVTSGGTGTGYFEWITSCNHIINSCSGGLRPSVYTFVIKVQDDFCPAPAIENTSQVISITVYPPCSNLKANEVVTAESVCGANDASIVISPSGGTPPYVSYFFDMNGLPVNPNALSAGDYEIRITDSTLCELIDTITILGPTPVATSNTQTICNGDSVVIGSSIYTNPGVYTDIYVASNGCDSVVTTTVIVNMSSTSTTYASVCDTSYMWNGTTYSITGVYTHVMSNANGCDSIATLDLTVNYSTSSTSSVTACDSYTWNGSVYTVSGSYYWFAINSSGCDSMAILNLTLNNSDSLSSNQTICSGESITVGSNVYTASGTYIDVLATINGCDSTIVTNLTVLAPISILSNIIPTSCNSYADGSIDITTSGGNGMYSYLWSTGATTEDITSLTAGVYSVQITDSLGCIYSDTMTVSEPLPLQLSLTSAGTNLTSLASGGTAPYNYEISGPAGFIAINSGNSGTPYTTGFLISGTYTFTVIDANGCMDSISSYINISSNFTPTVLVSLSNMICNSLADLTIEVSQDSGEVDMSTALIESNLGAFDIANMNIGDTIGTAYLMAGGGTISISTMIMVSNIISANQAVILACDTVLGCIGSFTINNNTSGGISILTSNVPDSNNYTSGNMSVITFDNCFINPCGTLTFTTTINSELGDVDIQTFNFLITSNIENYIENVRIFPNPTTDEITIDFNQTQEEVRITITDLLGKEIYFSSNYLNISKQNISFANLPKGSYVVLIDASDEEYSQIIIYQ